MSDPNAWDYSITALHGAASADIARAIRGAAQLGLEPIPDADPEPLANGAVRMWLHPTDPFLDDPFEETLCTSSN